MASACAAPGPAIASAGLTEVSWLSLVISFGLVLTVLHGWCVMSLGRVPGRRLTLLLLSDGLGLWAAHAPVQLSCVAAATM